MSSCQELRSFATEILSCIEEILDKINKLLSLLSQSRLKIFGPTVSSIISKTKCLRRLVRQTILLLQDDLLNTCESLANYGTNEEMYREIRGEISRKGTQQLQRFLDICTKRLNNTKKSYDKLCSLTIELCGEIDKAKQECEEVLESKKRRGVGEVTFGAAAMGGAVALALSSIPAPPLALVILGAGGFFGIFAGIYHISYRLDDDKKKSVEDAHAELEQLKSILHEIHERANKCARTIKRSAEDLISHDVAELTVQKGKTYDAYVGSLVPVNIPECFGLDNNQLKKLVTDYETDLNVTLDEFETHMNNLLAGTTDARAKAEVCIRNFPGA